MTTSQSDKKQLAEKFFRSRLFVVLHDLNSGDHQRRTLAEEELSRHGLTEKTARRRLSERLPE
jgi:hypothetical protein